jgi:acetyl-CoA carboxylase biotin carboxyl carrier protein
MSTVKAQMPGVFYRRPRPEAEAYVEEGTPVTAGQTVGLIEVTKTFSEVKVEHTGTAARFLLIDGEQVQAGQEVLEVEDDT